MSSASEHGAAAAAEPKSNLQKAILASFWILDSDHTGQCDRRLLLSVLEKATQGTVSAGALEALLQASGTASGPVVRYPEFIAWLCRGRVSRASCTTSSTLSDYLVAQSEELRYFVDPVNFDKLDVRTQHVTVVLETEEAEMVGGAPISCSGEPEVRIGTEAEMQRIVPHFDTARHRGLAIIGPAGSGKSTLAKQLAVTCIDKCLECPERPGLIPVVIPLNQLARELAAHSILGPEDLLKLWFDQHQPETSHALWNVWEKQRVLFYLDGLDETGDQLEGIKNWFRQLVSCKAFQRQGHLALISLRPSAHDGTYFQALQFQVLRVKPLSQEAAMKLVEARLLAMGCNAGIVGSIQQLVARSEFRLFAEVPLLLILLTHTLLQRGQAGEEETLRYIAKEAQRVFQKDVGDSLRKLAEPLKLSKELYTKAWESLRSSKSEQKAMKTLEEMCPPLISDEEWDKLRHGVSVDGLTDEDALCRVLRHAEQAQRALRGWFAPAHAWSEAVQDDHGCTRLRRDRAPCLPSWIEEVVDPGIKGKRDGGARIREKACSRLSGLRKRGCGETLGDSFVRLFDLSRFTLEYDNCAHLHQGLEALLNFKDDDFLTVISLSNRFARPTPLGYRDICLTLKFCLPDGSSHFLELQLNLRKMSQAKQLGHDHYKQIRACMDDVQLQSFVMDRLKGVREEALLWVDVADAGVEHFLQTWADGQLCRQSRIPDLKNSLRQLAWRMHERQQRHAAELDVLEASGGDPVLWHAASAERLALLEKVARSDPPKVAFFHLSFQTFMAAERLKELFIESEGADEQLLSLLCPRLGHVWWSNVFLDALTLLHGEKNGALRVARWVGRLAQELRGMQVLLRAAAAAACTAVLEAEQVLQKSVSTNRATGSQDSLVDIASLAHLLECLGRFDEAEPLFQEALEGRRRYLGDLHSDTLAIAHNFATSLYNHGRLDEAEPLFREALAGRKQQLGDMHPDTLRSIDSLANLLHARGRLDEAETLYREALQGRQQQFGDFDTDTLRSINNLAVLLKDRGHLDQAERLYRQALEARQQQLGDLHPDTLQSVNNLAVLLKSRDRIVEAEPLYRRALEGRRQQLGEFHSDTLQSVHNLAVFLKDQGHLVEAEPLLREALEGRRRWLGELHPQTMHSITNLAMLLYLDGRLDEAEPLFREALEGRRKQLGNQHRDTIASLHNLANLLKDRGLAEEAELLLQPLTG